MALIKDITTLKQLVKVNFTNQNSSMPDIAGAEAEYIVPIIGSTMYDALQAIVDANGNSPLLQRVRNVIAPIAYYRDLPIIHIQVGDKGIGTMIDSNIQAAHRWEYNELKDYFADKGCAALEVLLQYLHDNATALSWQVPDGYKLMFLTGKDFYKYYPIYQPYRTFESLRVIARQVEDEYIRPAIGDDFFIELRDNATPTADEKKAIELIKKSLANLIIKAATEKLPIKISTSGFTVLLGGFDTDSKYPGESSADSTQLKLLSDSTGRSGDNYLMQLKTYLNTNASTSLFTTYFNSQLYKKPDTTERESINSATNNFYM